MAWTTMGAISSSKLRFPSQKCSATVPISLPCRKVEAASAWRWRITTSCPRCSRRRSSLPTKPNAANWSKKRLRKELTTEDTKDLKATFVCAPSCPLWFGLCSSCAQALPHKCSLRSRQYQSPPLFYHPECAQSARNAEHIHSHGGQRSSHC